MNYFKKKLVIIFLILNIVNTLSASDALGETMSRRMIVFYEDVRAKDIDSYVAEWILSGAEQISSLPFINGIILNVPDSIASEELADDARVDFVETDQSMTLQAINASADGASADGASETATFVESYDAVDFKQLPWGLLRMLGMPYDPTQIMGDISSVENGEIVLYARKQIARNGIRVAVFDSGVDADHPHLWETINGGIDLTTGIEGIPEDHNGHGTHVAGTLFARAENSIKTYGIISGAQFYSVKVLKDDASGEASSLLMGLQWAIDNDIDVINMSIAYREDNHALRLAVQKAYEAGIVMVAAVGNHANWTDGASADGASSDDSAASETEYPAMYPAAYPEVIGVAAINPFGEITPFSNTGGDILAPGENVVSTNLGGYFGLCNGTSMAVPHVTGAAVLMLGLNPYLAPEQLISIIQNTSVNNEIRMIDALLYVYQNM